ncbi:hypothetical protein QVD17_11307 [Tagetes erecta]|uniref:Helicase C-terminal domain-containing protein n=1 Tax=Tagetes erecta TaxID=13708 RepID=A0AAD8NUT5_TARER|nr:hypothetical protein QVD17_11307 [Tagetes erecta]
MVSTLSATDDGLEISKIGISREIVTALTKKGIINLFPNQRAILVPAMQGRDLIVRHKTGTGMTLAFGIHIMHQIVQYNEEHGRGRKVHVKPSIIGPLIVEHANGGKCIIFTQTTQDADGLAYALQKSFRCEPLHDDISQSQRERTLSSFTDGIVSVLVATDVAARGLDDPNVALVIHYEPPNFSEVFVHRCGHTGRAGKKGSVILMYSSQQWKDVKAYERQVGCIFTELPPIGVDYVPIMKRAI